MLFGILPSPTPSPLIGLSKCNEFICLCVCLYVCNKVNVLAVVVDDDDIVCLFVVGFVVLNLYACVCVCMCVCVTMTTGAPKSVKMQTYDAMIFTIFHLLESVVKKDVWDKK